MGEPDFEPEETFRLTERRNGSTVVVALSGELDLATCDAVSQCLARLRDAGQATLLDLDGLTFIGSTGIRVLLVACHDAQRTSWRFAVTRGSHEVRRVLAATGVIDDLPYHDVGGAPAPA